jgi:hypothetical protein
MGSLSAADINVGSGGTLLVSPGQYTGSNALSEAITDNGSVVIAKTSSVALACLTRLKLAIDLKTFRARHKLSEQTAADRRCLSHLSICWLRDARP